MVVNSRREARIATFMQAWKGLMLAVQDATAGEWLRVNLTMAQVRALFVLHCHCSEAMSVGGVADVLQVGLPTASLLVDKLVQLDIVRRREDPGDRRRTLVELTERGEKLAVRMLQGRSEKMQRWLAQMDDDDFAALIRGLEALVAAASAERNGPEG